MKKFICPMDLFAGSVKKGSIYYKKDSLDNGYHLQGSSSNVFYLPSEIVETWESVERVFTLMDVDKNLFQLKVNTSGIFLHNGDKLDVDILTAVIEPLGYGEYSQVSTHITIPCGIIVGVDQIRTVLNYYNSLTNH